MSVAARRPTPLCFAAAEHALAYERQKFTCPGCGQEFERVVDAEGKPVEVADSGVARSVDGLIDVSPSTA